LVFSLAILAEPAYSKKKEPDMKVQKTLKARPLRLCFYRLANENEKLSTSNERLVLWDLTGEAMDAFLADHAPRLSVLSKKDMLDEIANTEKKVKFEGKARKDIDRLVAWVFDSEKPVIGYQQERVQPGGPNVIAPEALKERDDNLVFYLLDSPGDSLWSDQDRFKLTSLGVSFGADIAPYLTVEEKQALLARIPKLLKDFDADEKTRQQVTALVSWLKNSKSRYVGFQYELAQ